MQTNNDNNVSNKIEPIVRNVGNHIIKETLLRAKLQPQFYSRLKLNDLTLINMHILNTYLSKKKIENKIIFNKIILN